ncbi:MAG: hypothetical protein ACYTX0_43490 [Nostoc sp.]
MFYSADAQKANCVSYRLKRYQMGSIDNEAISQHLEALLTPAVFAQQKYYKQLELREKMIRRNLL